MKRTLKSIRTILISLALSASFSAPLLAQSNNLDNPIANAQAAIAKKDWQAAEAILQPLSQAQPSNPFVFFEMAQVYENTNRQDAAKQIYQSIATMPDAAQRQYTTVVRAASGSYMINLIGLAQTKLGALNAAAAKAAASAPAIEAKAATVAAVPVAAISQANKTSTEIHAAMQNWAKVWANKDLNGYFSSYTKGYKGDKTNEAAWKKFRTNNIAGKKTIALDFSDLQITSIAADKAQVQFQQLYASDDFKDISNKTMIWIKQGSTWLIEKETTQ